MKVKTVSITPLIVTVLLTAAAAQIPGGPDQLRPAGLPGIPGPEHREAGFRADMAQEFRDLVAEAFFPPEVIMKQARAIKLKDEQQQTIRQEMQKAQAAFVDFQWQLVTEMDVLAELLRDPKPDPAKVLAQSEKVMNIENSIKKTHLSLLLSIKTILTAEQQEQLRASQQRRGRVQQAPEGRMPPPGRPPLPPGIRADREDHSPSEGAGR